MCTTQAQHHYSLVSSTVEVQILRAMQQSILQSMVSYPLVTGSENILLSVNTGTGVKEAAGVQCIVMFSSFISINGSSSFHSTSEWYPVEMFPTVPPMAQINSSLPATGLVSAVMAMVPCPESPATDSGWGSWSAISLHSSSWDGSADLAPPRSVTLGGHSGFIIPIFL